MNFCWNFCCSIRRYAVQIVKVFMHSASEDDFICFGIHDFASSIEKFDLASSFVEMQD